MPTLTKFALHLSRLAAAAHQQSSSAFTHSANTLRGAFGSSAQSAASGSSSGAPGWAQGLASGAGNSGAGAGAGNAKFHAGRGAYYSYYGSHRALTNANTTSNDTSSSRGDDDEESLTVGPVAFSSRDWQIRPRRSLSTRGDDRCHLGQSHLAVGLSGLMVQKRYSHASARHGRGTLLLSSPAEAEDLVTRSSPSTPTVSRSRSNSTVAMKSDPWDDIAAALAPKGMQQSSSGSNPEESESTKREHPMYTQLAAARSLRDLKAVRQLVQEFRSLPRTEQSTATYNAAMEALFANAIDGSAVNDVTDAYVEMIEREIVPNSRTFSIVIRTLCFRDASLVRDIDRQILATNGLDAKIAKAIKEQGDNYTQALQLLGVAHTSKQKLSSLSPYNDLLAACALRGDAERALSVLAYIESNTWVQPNSKTYSLLIKTFANGSPIDADETLEQAQGRKLTACKQVFEEFLQVSADIPSEAAGPEASEELEGKQWQENYTVKVWNALIQAHFDLGDSAGAVGLLERMFESATKADSDSEQVAVAPDSSTMSIVIRSFVRSGDMDSAKAWFDKIYSVNASAFAKGDGIVVPYPSQSAMQPLAAALIASLTPEEKTSGSLNPCKVDNPDLQTLNNVFTIFSQARMPTAGTTTLLNAILRRNASAVSKATSEQAAAANTLLDRSLQHMYAIHGTDTRVEYTKMLESAYKNNVRSVTTVIAQLLKYQRFADASAALSYAAHLLPLPDDIELRVVRELLASEVHRWAMQIVGVPASSEGGPVNNEPPSKLPASPSVLLHLTLQVIIPALASISSGIPKLLRLPTANLWRRATAELDGHIAVVGLTQSSWGSLMECLSYELQKTSPSLEETQAEGLGLFFRQIATLDQSVRPVLRYNGLMRNMIDRYGLERASELVKIADPALAATIQSQPWGTSSTTSSAAADAISNAAQSDSSVSPSSDDHSAYTVASTVATPPLSPIYSQSPYHATNEDILDAPLDGSQATPPWSAMPMPLPAAPSVEDLPPVREVSQLLTQECESLWRDLRPRRQPSRRTGGHSQPEPEQAYKRFLASVQTGVYPVPETVGLLMTAYGRVGNVARVHHLYSIASHVVSNWSAGLARQADSWRNVEDAMINALAHAGDADGASTHRHRLIAGGHVPSANAYAALIATVKDTTDDATVALELFEEAVRLGTQPNVYLFNTVISKLSRARRADRALQLFDMMTATFKLAPSSVTYGAVINACTRTGDEEGAVQLFQLMEADRSFQPRVPPFNTMIQFFVEHKPDREKALSYYLKMRKNKVMPSAHTYKLLLDLYGCIQPVEETNVTQVFQNLIDDPEVQVQGTHWASLITSHGIHLSDLASAQEIFDSIAMHPSTTSSNMSLPDAVTFEALLNVFVKHGRIDLMRSHVQRMIDAQIRPTAYVANLLIKGYAADKSGAAGIAEARAVFEEMADPAAGVAAAGNHQPRQHGAGAPSSALTPAPDSKQRLQPLSGPHGLAGVFREPSTYEEMVRVELGEGGDRAAAEVLLQRMVARAFPEALVARVNALFFEASTSSETTAQSSPQ